MISAADHILGVVWKSSSWCQRWLRFSIQFRISRLEKYIDSSKIFVFEIEIDRVVGRVGGFKWTRPDQIQPMTSWNGWPPRFYFIRFVCFFWHICSAWHCPSLCRTACDNAAGCVTHSGCWSRRFHRTTWPFPICYLPGSSSGYSFQVMSVCRRLLQGKFARS